MISCFCSRASGTRSSDTNLLRKPSFNDRRMVAGRPIERANEPSGRCAANATSSRADDVGIDPDLTGLEPDVGLDASRRRGRPARAGSRPATGRSGGTCPRAAANVSSVPSTSRDPSAAVSRRSRTADRAAARPGARSPAAIARPDVGAADGPPVELERRDDDDVEPVALAERGDASRACRAGRDPNAASGVMRKPGEARPPGDPVRRTSSYVGRAGRAASKCWTTVTATPAASSSRSRSAGSSRSGGAAPRMTSSGWWSNVMTAGRAPGVVPPPRRGGRAGSGGRGGGRRTRR